VLNSFIKNLFKYCSFVNAGKDYSTEQQTIFMYKPMKIK